MNEVTGIFYKNRKNISVSGLADEDIKEVPNKEFFKNHYKAPKNNEKQK